MSGTITMTGEEYDALHAEAKALRAENAELRTALIEQGERQEAVAEIVCRRLLFSFALECNSIGLLGAAENLHKGMKEATAAHRQAQRKA